MLHPSRPHYMSWHSICTMFNQPHQGSRRITSGCTKLPLAHLISPPEVLRREPQLHFLLPGQHSLHSVTVPSHVPHSMHACSNPAVNRQRVAPALRIASAAAAGRAPQAARLLWLTAWLAPRGDVSLAHIQHSSFAAGMMKTLRRHARPPACLPTGQPRQPCSIGTTPPS